MSKALVLGGGSIKGAYQAGAIQAVFQAGFHPDLIVGISTGALCGGYIANHLGKNATTSPSPNWQAAADALVDFYLTKVTSPDVLIKQRGKFSIALSALRKEFDGLVDTSPVKKLIHQEMAAENIRKAPVQLEVGAVNLAEGRITYVDATSPSIVDYIYASTAEPITMPAVEISNGVFYDGGIVDTAPLGHAIDKGADELVVIVCQAKNIIAQPFEKHNLFHLIGRVMDIVSTEIIRNDLRQIQKFNALLANTVGANTFGPALMLDGKAIRHIKWKLIQPPDPISVKVDKFTSADIRAMVDYGRDMAVRQMQAPWDEGDID